MVVELAWEQSNVSRMTSKDDESSVENAESAVLYYLNHAHLLRIAESAALATPI